MPNWTFHNDWATRLGVPREIAKWVNVREDVPKFPEEDQKRYKGRVPKHPPTYQEMEKASIDHLKAWILHLLIDELEGFLEAVAESEVLSESELIKLATDGLQFSSLLRVLRDTGVEGEVKTFFLKNLGGISTGVYAFLKANNPYVEMLYYEANKPTKSVKPNTEVVQKIQELIKSGNIKNTNDVWTMEYVCPKCGYVWRHRLVGEETVLDPLKNCPRCLSTSK
jgi:rubrerythrin